MVYHCSHSSSGTSWSVTSLLALKPLHFNRALLKPFRMYTLKIKLLPVSNQVKDCRCAKPWALQNNGRMSNITSIPHYPGMDSAFHQPIGALCPVTRVNIPPRQAQDLSTWRHVLSAIGLSSKFTMNFNLNSI